ncbi:sodium-coupled monocarboxylate transporter 1-like [Periplaneta americana]|uniref:sodium-coupled monocarboxylate transporter 1-like n=1 Tax=Periplaneta americana TaxID=6978 RepID=UPI0037E8116D
MNITQSISEQEALQRFGWPDYSIFALMLLVSTMIGIYFGFWGKKEDTPDEYLRGGKKMNLIPVAVSLVVSFLSGIAVMGTPTDIYMYGTLYWLMCVAFVLEGLATNYIYLPVFYELNVTSSYEYLQLRFNRPVRVMASTLFSLYQLLVNPIVIYVPALAFSRVTGINVHVITPILSILCIIYTMLGGIKAVVWTDLLQGLLMFFACVAVIILGVRQLGGPGAVWQTNWEGGRIQFFELDPSPFRRMSFWIVIIGGTFHMIGIITLNQAMVQRYVSLPTYSKAKISIVLSSIGTMMLVTVTCYLGLLVYAHYVDCDPIRAKLIEKPDQLVIRYVMEVTTSAPGLPGFFIAGIFSASLSTMSSSLNSLGATVYEDFVRPCLRKDVTDKTANKIIKTIVVAFGALCVLIAFVVDKLGNVLQLAFSIGGITNGAMVGLFTFGMFFPRGNSKGALVGSIVSMLAIGWIALGAQMETSEGRMKLPKLPTRVDGCPAEYLSLQNATKLHNVTSTLISKAQNEDDVFILYRISFLYYTLTGTIIMIIVGLLVSWMTEAPDLEKMNPALFTPIVRKYVEKRRHRYAADEAGAQKLMRSANGD